MVNFLIAYFLLSATGCILAQHARFIRLAAGSAVAAVSSLILFAPEMPYLMQVGYKLLSGCLIVAAVFGCRTLRRYLAGVCWYTAFNLMLAGLAVLLILQTHSTQLQTGNLTVYLNLSPLVLILFSGLGCLAAELVSRFWTRPAASPKTVGLRFEICGCMVQIRAVLDTGCHVNDPLTCLPVLLVSFPDACSRLPTELSEFLRFWFSGKTNAEPPANCRLRLIPCTTAKENALLPGIAVSDIGLITEKGVLGLGRTTIAFAEKPFGTEEYEALYGSDFL